VFLIFKPAGSGCVGAATAQRQESISELNPPPGTLTGSEQTFFHAALPRIHVSVTLSKPTKRAMRFPLNDSAFVQHKNLIGR